MTCKSNLLLDEFVATFSHPKHASTFPPTSLAAQPFPPMPIIIICLPCCDIHRLSCLYSSKTLHCKTEKGSREDVVWLCVCVKVRVKLEEGSTKDRNVKIMVPFGEIVMKMHGQMSLLRDHVGCKAMRTLGTLHLTNPDNQSFGEREGITHFTPAGSFPT